MTKYLHSGLKNVDAQSSASQSITATRGYDAFGNVESSSGSWTGAFGYGGPYGYQSSSEGGLMLLGHRYYDPSMGRFLTRDPVKEGQNWYGYVGGNPLGRSDARGLYWIHIVREGVKYIIFPTPGAMKSAIRQLPQHIRNSVRWDPGHGIPPGPPHINFDPKKGAPKSFEPIHVTHKGHADEAAEAGAESWGGWGNGGKRRGNPWKGLLLILISLVTADPAMAGEALGDVIDGPVSDASDGYSGWTYGGRAGISPRELMNDIY